MVTSLFTYLGREGNLLTEEPQHARLIKLKTPIISNDELGKLAALDGDDHKAVRLSMLFDVSDTENGLAAAIEKLWRRSRAGRPRAEGDDPHPKRPWRNP